MANNITFYKMLRFKKTGLHLISSPCLRQAWDYHILDPIRRALEALVYNILNSRAKASSHKRNCIDYNRRVSPSDVSNQKQARQKKNASEVNLKTEAHLKHSICGHSSAGKVKSFSKWVIPVLNELSMTNIMWKNLCNINSNKHMTMSASSEHI